MYEKKKDSIYVIICSMGLQGKMKKKRPPGFGVSQLEKQIKLKLRDLRKEEDH